VAFGTINVIGGFVVTDRMLGMFKGKSPAERSSESGAAQGDLPQGESAGADSPGNGTSGAPR